MQGLAHDARREHFLGSDLLAEHRVRIVYTVAPVLDDDGRKVLLREIRLAQQPLRAQREVSRRGGEPGLLAPRFEERRADDALRHLLDPENQHAVVLPGADRACRELQRRTAARAAGFDVDDRTSSQCERAEHLVSRRDAAVRGATERGLKLRVTGLGERGANSVDTHLGVRYAVEPPERVEADAGDGYSNAHVTAPPSSSSTTSVIACPNDNRDGSASFRRVMTRSCSRSSSTTPNPYGTSPRYPGGGAVTAVHAHNAPWRESSTRCTSRAPEYGHVSSSGK